MSVTSPAMPEPPAIPASSGASMSDNVVASMQGNGVGPTPSSQPATAGPAAMGAAMGPGGLAAVAMPGAAVAMGADEDAGASAPPDAMMPPEAGFPFPPLETSGEPLPGEVGEWSYVELPDTSCRDGSPAGVYINLGSSNKLMIVLEGGGRCSDEATCSLNFANVEAGTPVRLFGHEGLTDRSRVENPVRDWNWVQVPYCTGDRHGGANPEARVPGVDEPQMFVGHTNMAKFLDRIVPTFADATDVLITGTSAGGHGVWYTAVLVQRAFPGLKVKLVSDSGAFVSTAVFAECDQERMRVLGKTDDTFLGECGSACPNGNDYWMDFGKFLAATFADRPIGLVTTTGDITMRQFYSTGVNDCKGSFDLLNPDPAITAAAHKEDLLAFKDMIEGYPNFSTFYVDNETHTYLMWPEFYTITAGGVRLLDWFTQIVNGESPGHAGP